MFITDFVTPGHQVYVRLPDMIAQLCSTPIRKVVDERGTCARNRVEEGGRFGFWIVYKSAAILQDICYGRAFRKGMVCMSGIIPMPCINWCDG